MRAIENEDGEALYRFIDERARHALGGIVGARKKAEALITADYPEADKAGALAALGDAAQVDTAAELFAKRCTGACMAAIGQTLAAPTKETPVAEGVLVHTTKGTTLHMFVGKDSWYGLVWNTHALMEERDRASRELTQLEDNAALYRKQRGLTVAPSAMAPARTASEP